MDADTRRWAALGLLCAANFMVVLDSQIVLLALPSVERDLGFTGGGAQWVMSAYLLGFGGLLLLGGRTADLAGRRRTFLAGTGLFLVASLLCGSAWNGGALIGARVAQGVSAALMAPSALSILTATFAEGRRGTGRSPCGPVWAGSARPRRCWSAARSPAGSAGGRSSS
ncbi:MFS transporter [Actinomadura luteofluorescens]|uniref:MFS transporter n=1 Tax=Actinomadura luteofluorescens TaxID=46163 RepID=UPI003640FFAF